MSRRCCRRNQRCSVGSNELHFPSRYPFSVLAVFRFAVLRCVVEYFRKRLFTFIAEEPTIHEGFFSRICFPFVLEYMRAKNAHLECAIRLREWMTKIAIKSMISNLEHKTRRTNGVIGKIVKPPLRVVCAIEPTLNS